MTKTLLLVAAAVGIGVIGQLCLKVGMSRVGYLGIARLMVPSEWIPKIITTPQILVTIPLYMLGFSIWLIVLSRAELSFVYPLLSGTYILVPLSSYLILKEAISSRQWVGMLVICLGVLLVLSSKSS